MTNFMILTAIACGAITACTAISSSTTAPSSQYFSCEDGREAHVFYHSSDEDSDENVIKIKIGSDIRFYKQAVSASGSRYVSTKGLLGYGGEWHEKNDDAILSYQDENGINHEVACHTKK